MQAGLARAKGKVSLPSNEKGFKDKLYWTRDQAHPAAAAAARAARRTPPHTSAREQVHLLTPTLTLTLTLTRGQVHLLRRLQKELVEGLVENKA